MKTLLRKSGFFSLMILITNFLPGMTVVGQSCSSNDLGFNGNSATNSLTICSGTTGTTLDADDPTGTETYLWEVSTTSATGPFSTVSPNPGSVEDWTISSTYYNTSGTYYFRRVVSANAFGCNGNSDVVKLTVRFSPLVSNNGTNSANCTPTGSIILYGSGGVTPYTFSIDGSTYYSDNNFTNLGAGTYTGYVKDNLGCVGTKSGIVITAAAAIIVTATPRQASSCADNGSIDLFLTGGIGPYTYSLDDITYQGSNSITNLAAGTYTCWVKDSKGCKGSLSGIVVTKAAVVTLSATPANTSSCGNTGTIQLHPGGGIPGYTYSLDDITYQAGNLFTGLAAGSYTGWTKDSKNCKASVSTSVGTNPGTTINVTATPTSSSSCNNTGTIQLFRTGGTGPYTYSKDDITYQVSNTITGLAAGTYTCWVKDVNGCKGSLSGITVTQTSAVSVSASHINSGTCVNSGSITLTASGGVATYSYSIDDITYQAGRSFTGLAVGTYTAWVKDGNGCKASVIKTITQNPIVVTAYAGNASTCGGSNGSIQLFRTGGTSPYSYSLNGTTYQSSNSFSSLSTGTYTGYVKDTYGCIGTLSNINVGPQSSTITLTSAVGTAAQAVCKNAALTSITYAIGGGGTGASITAGALPAGVTGTYSAGVFTINGTATSTGVYNYTITTTGSCSQVTANGTLTVNEAPSASFTKTMASSCGGGADGTITVTVSSGVAPFTYSWTGPGGFTASTAAITSLSSGDYTVVINDAASACVKTIPDITIWQAQQPVVTNNGAISSSCSATGTIIMYASHGVAPFSFSVDGSNYQSGNSFANLAPGSYTGYVKDLAGCIGTKTIVVGSAAPINVTAYPRAATNCATSNGSIQLFLTGGISPYTYSVDGVNYQTGSTVSGLAAGIYRGYVKDSKGCVGTLPNINVGPGCGRMAGTEKTTGVSANSQDNNKFSVEVFPNPSSSEFSLLIPRSSRETVFISVSDIAGRKIYEAEFNDKRQIRFGKNFKPGMYIVTITQGTKKQSIKLTKE